MFSHRLITKSLTIGLAASALGASSAPAGPPLQPIMTPQEQQVIASRGQGAPAPDVVSSTAPQAGDTGEGFDWGSAAIGAGAGAVGGVSILVALGAFGLSDGRRVRVAR